MKIRFIRDALTAYLASQIEVDSVAELYAALRKEKNLSEDFDLENKLKISPASEEIHDPALVPLYQIYVVDVGLLGFSNGPLKDIQEKHKEPIPQGPYRIDTDRAEHKCCWNSAIVRPPNAEEKRLGIKTDVRILECGKEHARLIRDALNAYHTLNKKA